MMTQTITDRSLYMREGRVGLLLVHGLGGTPVELKSIARAHADAGFSVHCCQLAGHCGSEADLLASRWQDWAASVEAGYERLRGDCDVIFVGGLSMGAILALGLAGRHPDSIAGLVLYAPTLWYDGWSIPRFSFLLRMFIRTPMGRRWRFVERYPYGIKDERMRGIVVKAMLANTDEAGHLSTPAQVIQQFWLLVDEILPDLPKIRVPTFIAHARADDLSSLKNAVHIQNHLGGIVETLILDDSYHLIIIDKQRHLLCERSIAFVASYAGRQRRLDQSAASRQSVAIAAE